MNKKNLFLWSLYDFANSLVFINFLLYFSQWLVIDGGFSDLKYNAIFAITTLLLLCSAPALASYTDIHGGRRLFLTIATIATFISYGIAATCAYAGTTYMLFAAFFFLVGQYFYQLSFVFYNAMIDDVADEQYRARASGIGQFTNASGQVVGIIMTLPLATSRVLPLFPALGIFLLLSLPLIFYFKESRPFERYVTNKEGDRNTNNYLKKLWVFLGVSASVPMLLSFFLFNDALVTLSNNFAIVLEQIYAVSDTTKSLILIGILISSAIGGLVFGWVADKFGALITLKLILLGWIILLPLIAFAPTFTIFALLSVPIGLFIGSAFSVSRAYFSTLVSKEHMTYGFSFYTLAERFSTLLGPLTWGGIIWIMGNNQAGYQTAIISMTLFVFAGLVVLSVWKRKLHT
jgi:UMF1 family MFS transporter